MSWAMGTVSTGQCPSVHMVISRGIAICARRLPTVVKQREFISPAEVESLKRLAASIKTDGSWAGEDAIVVTANYL